MAAHGLFSAKLQTAPHNLCMPKKNTDPIAIEMGRRIAEERKARGLTQEQLAALTGWKPDEDEHADGRGLSPSRIANYEQGSRRIGNEEAEIFATAFPGLPPAYFMALIDVREARVLYAMRHEHPQRAAS